MSAKKSIGKIFSAISAITILFSTNFYAHEPKNNFKTHSPQKIISKKVNLNDKKLKEDIDEIINDITEERITIRKAKRKYSLDNKIWSYIKDQVNKFFKSKRN